MGSVLEYCMCEKDEWITSGSTGETEWDARGNGMPRCTGWLVKAGSAYYHNPNTQENFWLEYEVIPSVIEEGNGSYSHEALGPEGGSGLSAAELLLQDIRNCRLTGGNRNDIIKEIAYNSKRLIIIARIDFYRLIRGHQINDVIINAYVSMLNARQTTNYHVMDTSAMWYLRKGQRVTGEIDPMKLKDNLQSFKQSIKKTLVDIKKRDRIIFPIHGENGTHWEMCVIDLKFKFIRYYDSCAGWRTNLDYRKRQNINIILEWIRICWEVETRSGWGSALVSKAVFNIPSQADGNDRDCGVLMLKYIECIVSGQPLDDMCKVFTLGDSQMMECRERIAKTLMLL